MPDYSDTIARAFADTFLEARQAIVLCARDIAFESTRPSTLYRPAVYPDGNMWCVLYGENVQDGVAGFGETPEAAMRAFDHAWRNERAGNGGTE